MTNFFSVIKYFMYKKGLDLNVNMKEDTNEIRTFTKHLNEKNDHLKKVDINVLKKRIQSTQEKENKKNIIIITFFLIIFSTIGIYLSI